MRHVIVCNDKGGVGKTLVTHLLAILALDRNEKFRIIECEKMPRLQHLFGDIVDYRPIEQDRVSEIYENPDVLFTYWDEIAETLDGSSRCLIDMGAGVTFPFCRWAQAGGQQLLADGANITLAIVTTVEAEAWKSAKNNIRMLREILPKAEVVVIYNERDGDFYGQELAPVPGVTLAAVRVPGWAYLQNAGRFDLLAQRSGQEIARTCNLPLGTATRSMYAFTDWLLQATDALAPVLDCGSYHAISRQAAS